VVRSLAEVKAAKLAELRDLRLEVERRESARLAQVDVFGLLGYVPTPKQAEFHAATEFSVLFGGSAGGGKSRALTAEAVRACVRYPGIRVGAFRRTYPELKESLIAELAQMGYASALGAVWNGSDFELRFTNGSLLMFRYAETLTDATRRQGGQYQLLVFDERTLTPAEVLSFLESRLRSGRTDIPVLGIRSSANPGGASHGDVKQKFITATNYGEKVILDERGRTVRFIPSRLDDNPHINPEYAADLRALPEKLRQAFLDGNWDVFAGQAFGEWRHDRHVVEPFTIPPSWKRYNGIDGGFRAPWCTLWAAEDPDGRVWFYREIYSAGVGETDQAKQILAAEEDGEHVAVRFADDSLWAVTGESKSTAAVYADNGVYITAAGKGAGSRVTRVRRTRTYLGEAPACAHHRALGLTTCPLAHFFPQCENLIRTLPVIPHARVGNPEDVDTDSEDHAYDAMSYLLINIGTGAEFTVFPGEEPNAVAAAITPLEPMGAFAVDRDPGEPSWLYADDDDAPRRTVRTAELRGVAWPSGTGSAVTAAMSPRSKRRRGR
jgi:Terminase large subunit, T4likevirus-type, N-terminal